MKKIILIFIIFLMTGCYDYSEINDLAIVSAIGIDYDKEFNLTFEILNDKSSENPQNPKGYTINGNGPTLAQAFNNITLKISKVPYYYHIKAIIVDEETAKNHMQEFVDYFVRAFDIRNEFYLTVCVECKSSDIINSSNEDTPVIADSLSMLIQTSNYNYNAAYSKPFEDVMEKMVNDKTDAITSAISLKNNKISIAGLAVFHDYKYTYLLESKDSTFLNLLLEEKSNALLTKYYNGKPFSINIDFSKIKYQINDKNINIRIVCEGSVKENVPNLNLKDEDVYKKLIKEFKKLLLENLNNTLNLLKKENLDILGLQDLYYKKTKKVVDVYRDINITFDIDMRINKKGLIFEVDNG